jgi:hypothetical protein
MAVATPQYTQCRAAEAISTKLLMDKKIDMALVGQQKSADMALKKHPIQFSGPGSRVHPALFQPLMITAHRLYLPVPLL